MHDLSIPQWTHSLVSGLERFHCILQTACAQYLKAHAEYLRQNYRKALKVLGSAPKNPIGPDTGECLSSYFFNDLGCVQCTLGKYSLAAHYFRKALEENDAALNGFPPLDKGEYLSYTARSHYYCYEHAMFSLFVIKTFFMHTQ